MEPPATFDEAVGLWIDEGPGHTAPVSKLPRAQNGRNAVMRLIRAAQTGSLKDMPVTSVLRALEAMQVRDPASAHDGCFRWYWEETKPVDTNAAFFIGMGLLVLNKARGADLDEESRQQLQQMFPPLERWFDREVKSRTFYYPNKYLGDLVCAWLLRDYSRSSVEELRAATFEATAYWQEQSWGWGEHMSDVYAKVMLNQLSVLLLYAEHLPPDVRAAFQDLAQGLLVINDAFAGGPRVPLIRGYAFQKSPHENSFRDSIYDWKRQGTLPPTSYTVDSLGYFFWERGWHDVFGAKTVSTRDHTRSLASAGTRRWPESRPTSVSAV
jgi:hypothetical protein